MPKFFGCLLVAVVFPVSAEAFAAEEAAPARECLEGGKLFHLGSSSNGGWDVVPSKDKSSVLVGSYNSDSFRVFNMKTKEIKEFSKPPDTNVIFLNSGEVAYTKFDSATAGSPSAKTVFEAAKKAKTVAIDPKTGRKREIVGKIVFTGGELYTLESYNADNSIVLKSESGLERTVPIGSGSTTSDVISRYTEDASEPDVRLSKKTGALTISQKGKDLFKGQLKPTTEQWFPGGFTRDRQMFITTQKEQVGTEERTKLVVIDLVSKTQKSYDLPKGYRGGEFTSRDSAKKLSKDSRFLLLNNGNSDNKAILSIELKTGALSTLAQMMTWDPYFDDAGNVCGESMASSQEKTYRQCFDSKNGKSVSRIETPFDGGTLKTLSPTDFLVSTWGGGGQDGQSFYFSHKKICPNLIVPIECDCLIPRVHGESKNLEVISSLALVAACSKDFNQADWNNLPLGDVNLLNERASLVWLKRFSKPGGFQTEPHAGILLGMLKAGVHKKYPAEFKAGLGGVIVDSDRFYDSLLKKYPEIADLPEKVDQTCLTKTEQQRVSKAIFEYTKARLLTTRRPKFTDLKAIVSLARDSLTDEKQKESLAELAADQLIFTAGDSPELNRVFTSKIYKFAENKMKEAIGLKFKDLTDLTVTRDADTLTFHQLGVRPFDGAKETVAGFYTKPVKTVSVTALPANKSVETLSWTYQGKEFSAEIDINKQKLDRAIVTEGKSPDYGTMWKDNQFRGVIIAGANLGSGLTETVMQEYIEYYTKQGFKFGEPIVNDDIPKFLQDAVTGEKPMHYFVKEAHSDGDEKNLFRVGQKGKVLRGVRTDGKKREMVDLVFPTTDMKSTLLSNQDFGKWIQQREKSGKPELVYLNSSCWSKSKAVFEVSAAMSPTLINIPTTTSMTTFVNHENSAMFAAVDGIRKQLSYEKIRETMKKDKKYESKNGNVFIFPDEEEYKKQITDVLRVPVDVNPRLYSRSAGGPLVPYSIEDTH